MPTRSNSLRKTGFPIPAAPRVSATIGRGLGGLNAPIDRLGPADLLKPSWRTNPTTKWFTIIVGGAAAVALLRWAMLLMMND